MRRMRIPVVLSGAVAALAVLATAAMAATIVDNDRGHRLTGTRDADTILAAGGPDRVRALAGDDFVDAGWGRDRVWAGPGDDTVGGGDGRDVLWAGPGNDTSNGGDKRDLMFGGYGDDVEHGGNGNDVVFANRGVDQVFGDAGNDRLWALARADVDTSSGPDVVADSLTGGEGNDVIHARDGEADHIDCGPGNDRALLDQQDVIVDATQANPNGSCETVVRKDPKPREAAPEPAH